jgi:ribosomal protein L16 Arg81 hydroxylase
VQQQYKPDFDKIKCLEIVLKPGSMLFIPSFWWHSFQFSDKTSLCTFKYRTYMNTLANMPRFIMKFLQSQNVKRNVVKQFDNSKSNNIIYNSNDNTEKNLVNNVEINQLASVDNNLDNNIEINQLVSVDNNPNTSLISK